MFFVKEGVPFIVLPVAAGVMILAFTRGIFFAGIGWILIIAGIFCMFFFRDPARSVLAGDNLVVSPCDGTVLEVTEEGGTTVIRMFLSIFNVHVQRSPVAGTVKGIRYKPGKFLPAMQREAHLVNEQNVFTIETQAGNYVVTQIAGILARRVVSWVKPGQVLGQGEKLGCIKFGSQVDISIPARGRIAVKTGDAVIAGRTVLFELQSSSSS